MHEQSSFANAMTSACGMDEHQEPLPQNQRMVHTNSCTWTYRAILATFPTTQELMHLIRPDASLTSALDQALYNCDVDLAKKGEELIWPTLPAPCPAVPALGG